MRPMADESLFVPLGERSYPILITYDHLARLGETIRERMGERPVLLVSDDRVDGLHGKAAEAALGSAGLDFKKYVFPAGESSKNLETCARIWTFLLENNYPRDSVLIALGGGVVGDVTGFVAAAYMRGVPYVQVPTTLLAMVDSSVGGKTGVNHPLGKNMIGAFHQPALVFIDLATLKTLPPEEFRAGFAEVIKYGVIRDEDFFAFCETEREAIFSLDPAALGRTVRTSCSIKADVVAADEREAGIRAILNFGHTVGHAIESLTGYSRFRHGEAVAIGMIAAGLLAVRLGYFDSASQERLEKLVEQSGLPACIPADLATEEIIERLGRDKKVRGGRVRFVLPEAIGRVRIESDISFSALKDVLDEMKE